MAKKGSKKEFDAILKDLEPKVRDAFLKAVADLKSSAQVGVIEAALKSGDIDRVIEALNLRKEFYEPLQEAVRQAYLAGGNHIVDALGTIPATASTSRLVVKFGGTNPRAEKWLREMSSELIVDITRGQIDAVRVVLDAGLKAGRNPRGTALDIVGRINRATGKREGGILGLLESSAQQVEDVRSVLKDPVRIREYFIKDQGTGDWKPRWTRTDRRFDRQILRAIKNGKALDADTADKISTHFSNRLLKARGDLIAENETLGALNAGKDEGIRQILDTGAVRVDQIEKEWDSTGDNRVRESHREMDGQKRGFNDPFNAPSGAQLMFPHDTSLGAPAKETIRCRCYYAVRIDYLKDAR